MPLIDYAYNTITLSPFSTVQNAHKWLKMSVSTSPQTFSSTAWYNCYSTTIQTAPFTKRKNPLSAAKNVLPHPWQLWMFWMKAGPLTDAFPALSMITITTTNVWLTMFHLPALNAKPALKKSMSTSPPTFSSNAWPKTTSTTIQTAPFTKRTLSTANSVLPRPWQLWMFSMESTPLTDAFPALQLITITTRNAWLTMLHLPALNATQLKDTWMSWCESEKPFTADVSCKALVNLFAHCMTLISYAFVRH